MNTYELIIKLQSDLSPGSGDSTAGVVDHEITHEHGIPVIPAKRIKGALRAVAKELVDWEWKTASLAAVNELYGEAGQQFNSGFKIYDAELYTIPIKYFSGNNEQEQVISDYKAFLAQIKQHRAAKLLPLFTMFYTKTSIEEGIAQTGSLRTIQVINKGLVFKCIIELDSDKHEQLLRDCVKGLRHLGYSRTRGLGEVVCELKSIEKNEKTSKTASIGIIETIKQNIISQTEQTYRQPFRITLQQPALLAGEKGLYYSCTNFVPGSALLGVFASLYIKKYGLGQEAHKNTEFVRLFLRGDVAFGYAYPEVERNLYMPCPAHIERVKNEQEALFAHLNKNGEKLRRISGLVHMDKDTLRAYEPEQQFRMHHSRPADRQYGRALNDTPNTDGIKGEKGQFYYYTSSSAGQSFVGELKGKQEDIEMLFTLLNETNDTIHLGRSRTAEYGAAKIETINYSPTIGMKRAEKGDRIVAIYLATPLTLQNEIGRYVADPTLLIKKLEWELGTELQVNKLYLKQTMLTGYNAKWRLPKQGKPALDAGTVLVVSAKKEIDWMLLEEKQWGEEQSQGCGEIMVFSYKDFPEKLQFESLDMNVSNSEVVFDSNGDEKLKEVLTSIKKEIEQIEATMKDKKEAIKFFKSNKSELLQYSNSKIYQLEQCLLVTEDFVLPSDYPEKLKGFVEKNFRGKSKPYIQSYFQAVKLEVRKNAQK